jgi:hypothetical protein
MPLPSDPRDYILDLTTSLPPESSDSPIENQKSKIENPRAPYLSIHFRCCNVYAPIYKNAAATAYAGHCPRCQRPATIPIGPGGTKSRIFQAE